MDAMRREQTFRSKLPLLVEPEETVVEIARDEPITVDPEDVVPDERLRRLPGISRRCGYWPDGAAPDARAHPSASARRCTARSDPPAAPSGPAGPSSARPFPCGADRRHAADEAPDW